MKLRELVSLRESTLRTMTPKQAHQVIEDITTHNHDYDRQAINQAVEVLMQDPKLVYRGPMYRVIFMDQQAILDRPDVRTAMAKLHDYDLENGDREWFSWTRSLRDVQGFTMEAFENKDPDDNEIAVIFGQRGTGLDVVKTLGYDFMDENEVLGKMSGNLQLIGFAYWPQDQERPTFTSKDGFKRMLQILQKQSSGQQEDDEF